MTVGIIGTGFVGSAYARYFIRRGFRVTQYSLDPQFIGNKDFIKNADIVLICVPTPTDVYGADISNVAEVLGLVGANQIAIIKSTVPPRTAEIYQRSYPGIIIVSSPEFLSADTADRDVKSPILSLIGLPTILTDAQKTRAEREFRMVMRWIPGQTFVMTSTEAEIVKYAHNASAVLNTLLYNILWDVAQFAPGASYEPIRDALLHDPYVASQYSQPIHKGGRGAGGPCFIKDFEAFRRVVGNHPAVNFLREAAFYNNELLWSTDKDKDLIKAIYFEKAV